MPKIAKTLFAFSGVVFLGAIQPASAGALTTLHIFQGAPDGAGPVANLVAAGGRLYGTTYLGGTANDGTVFSVNRKTGATKIVYSFQGGEDGASPLAGLTVAEGALYGVTSHGGAADNGTVFSLNIRTGTEQVLHVFKKSVDGAHPQSSLLRSGDMVFGTTTNGGTSGKGTVFSLNMKTARYRVLHSFLDGGDGAYPFASLIKVGSMLYGTASGGGSTNCAPNGCGTVFSLDLATGAETTVYAFQGGNDGATPYGGLIKIGGLLHGTTADGGGAACSRGCGTIFSVDAATGVEKVDYAFQNNGDGAVPLAGLIDIGGTLFGTAQEGGADRLGSVFAFNPASMTISTVYSFAGGNDGANPYGGLISVSGALYGTTQAGGTTPHGTVFAVTP